MDGSDLAILIPAHCEAATIGPVVAAASIYGTVIVVDDFSGDQTGAIAARAGAVVVRNERKCGYDGTLNRAFEEAAARGFKAVVTMDADGEHDPRFLTEFRHLLIAKKMPMVFGFRPRKQRFAESVMGVYIKARFGVEDILCGMKGYDLQLWHENKGFDHTNSIGTELALNSVRRQVKFCQLPVYGGVRQDQPRFGRSLRANWRIFVALFGILRRDFEQFAGFERSHG